ncbi:unnamed protein product [Darwinula stevensoni]|uniref:Zinc finger CCCH domain-containing protein 14 n=1 Tax=Darwinula stevensoni TaxID=69355 RepID=A0A7R9ACY3_9CRUS|nr:unnamed protein product [Darwinula stevensoni]CAG0900518.1 unnamed protein product [Darwinula stevensoni]
MMAMDTFGSELVTSKVKSAIRAKLVELGAYVDEELPDYVMIMIANKKTKEQMEEDLVLFLGEKTQVFSQWLHDILQKLQQVTVHEKSKKGSLSEKLPKTEKEKSSSSEAPKSVEVSKKGELKKPVNDLSKKLTASKKEDDKGKAEEEKRKKKKVEGKVKGEEQKKRKKTPRDDSPEKKKKRVEKGDTGKTKEVAKKSKEEGGKEVKKLKVEKELQSKKGEKSKDSSRSQEKKKKSSESHELISIGGVKEHKKIPEQGSKDIHTGKIQSEIGKEQKKATEQGSKDIHLGKYQSEIGKVSEKPAPHPLPGAVEKKPVASILKFEGPKIPEVAAEDSDAIALQVECDSEEELDVNEKKVNESRIPEIALVSTSSGPKKEVDRGKYSKEVDTRLILDRKRRKKEEEADSQQAAKSRRSIFSRIGAIRHSEESDEGDNSAPQSISSVVSVQSRPKRPADKMANKQLFLHAIAEAQKSVSGSIKTKVPELEVIFFIGFYSEVVTACNLEIKTSHEEEDSDSKKTKSSSLEDSSLREDEIEEFAESSSHDSQILILPTPSPGPVKLGIRDRIQKGSLLCAEVQPIQKSINLEDKENSFTEDLQSQYSKEEVDMQERHAEMDEEDMREDDNSPTRFYVTMKGVNPAFFNLNDTGDGTLESVISPTVTMNPVLLPNSVDVMDYDEPAENMEFEETPKSLFHPHESLQSNVALGLDVGILLANFRIPK